MVSEGQNGKRTSTRKGRRGTKDRSLLARFDRFASTLSLSPPLYHPFTTPSALFFRSFFSLSHSSRFLISVYDTPLCPLRCLFSLLLSFFPSFSFVLFSFPLSFFFAFYFNPACSYRIDFDRWGRGGNTQCIYGCVPLCEPFLSFFPRAHASPPARPPTQTPSILCVHLFIHLFSLFTF